ncbi:hypothetical protein Tco_0199855 [Tanacetum coccineum]
MSNTNLQTQSSSVLQNVTVSSCSTSNIQEKTQLSRSRCMHSLKEIKSLFKFLSETLQDYGTMPIFKRTFSQDLDLLEQHLTKDILSRTDCTTTLTNLRTKFENAFNSEFEERMRKYTRYNAQSFNDAMICTMDSIRKYMLEIILHQQRTLHLLKQKTLMQTQEDHSSNSALNVKMLIISKYNDLNVDQLQKKLDKDEFQEDGSMAAFWVGKQPNTSSKNDERRVNKEGCWTQKSRMIRGKAWMLIWVYTESIRYRLNSARLIAADSGMNIDADDARYRPISAKSQ